ncbi:uncharacterized protein LOC123559947 isoform X2 [Mercenaria mercenaria]|nr:uncharacterized protein LOC123559947 isoform X2 [Mercenaria mercenaria]
MFSRSVHDLAKNYPSSQKPKELHRETSGFNQIDAVGREGDLPNPALQNRHPVQASESPDKSQDNENNQSDSQTVTEVTKQGLNRNVTLVRPSLYQDNTDAIKQLEQIFSPPKDKPRRKCTHEGRLLTLEPNHMKTIFQLCRSGISGGFGEVRISDSKVPGLNIKVAVKKIEARSDKIHKLRSMTNEKLASRTMHFAIVPILANCTEINKGTNTCYFLSPYLEKGDLFELIKSDTAAMKDNRPVELNKQRRTKIMYHVSSAIEFLHRKIANFRGPIIHLDVKSKNIVLDQFYNARLTDFGVSREMAENEECIITSNTIIPATDGYFQTNTTGQLRKYFDYVNVGIVIRELLSGLPPIFSENKYLKDIANMKVFKRKTMKCWTNEEVETLFDLSNKCINDISISADEIVTKIEAILRKGGTAKWNRADESLNCEMCIVNPAVEEKLLAHKSCQCSMRVCVSCMRNEYLNPMLCHSCGQVASVIDSANLGAILIAGIDKGNAEFSKVCLKDIEDIRDVFISKFPLVIGMRKENVKVLTMLQPSPTVTTGPTIPKIHAALEELKNSPVHTLFIYFSGHYIEENGFLVGYKNEYLKKEDLKQMIECFSEKEVRNKPVTSSVRFIVVLDCCAAPGIASDSMNLNVNTSVVQLNACRPNEESFTVQNGSIFKRFFVQGLTTKATKEPCYIRHIKRERIDAKVQSLQCETCPIKGDDFVTVENLHSYIQGHLQEFSQVNGSNSCTAVIHVKNMKAEDAILGYLCDSEVSMQFLLRYEKARKDDSCKIPHQFYSDMSPLKTLLFDKYMEKLSSEKIQPILKAEDFKDICCIEIELGPKTKHKQEIKSIEQLNSAWNAKRELVVSLRDISKIHHGMVGSFMSVEDARNYLFKSFMPIDKPNLTVVILTYEELEKVLEDGNFRKYGEFFEKLETLRETMEELDIDMPELHIIFPCTEDDNRMHRPDFVCFELVSDRSEDKQPQKELDD